MPFMGEEMTCAICGKKQKSNPKAESNWRMIQLPTPYSQTPYYICAKHFPADGSSSRAFAKAYQVIIKRLFEIDKQGGH